MRTCFDNAYSIIAHAVNFIIIAANDSLRGVIQMVILATKTRTCNIYYPCSELIMRKHECCLRSTNSMPALCSIHSVLEALLTSWSRVHLEKLTDLQLAKKFPAFYGTRRLITAFTIARHLSLPTASSIQSIPPHPTSWRSIIILSSHLRLGLPNGLFPLGFPTKILYTLLPSSIRATYPAHLIILDFITRTVLGEEYRTLTFWRRNYFFKF